METLYRERRPFVAKFLETYPLCQRCLAARSTVVHEVVTRARRGSILDEDNCRALCEEDHQWVHSNPAKATEEGFLKSGKKKIGV